jgi:micrococcal nuclease
MEVFMSSHLSLRPRFGASAFIAVLSLTACGAAPLPPPAMKVGETGLVISVISGDTLQLKSGLTVRLAGIVAPRAVPGDPFGARATATLKALTLGKTVELRYGGNPRDRSKRALAHVFVRYGNTSMWIEPEMLKRGMAAVRTYNDNRTGSNALYVAEREARLGGKGIWASPIYGVKAATPAALARSMDSFQIVEGIVVKADARGNVIFLNFGDDWRTDVTAVVPVNSLALWKGGAQAVTALEGRRVRVRGQIVDRNGPSIYVTHPEQVEVIGAART